jgi:hypothetical protein
LRAQTGEELRHDVWPLRVEWLVEIHRERDRPSADERQRNVVPVALRLVLDDRPSLDARDVRLGFEQQTVARLPDRRLDDVADAHATIAGAGEGDRHRFLVLIARLGESGKRLAQLVLELGVVEREVRDRLQLDGSDRGAAQEVEYG